MSPFRFYEAVQTSQREFDTTRLSLNGVNVWMIIRLIMLGRLSGEVARRLSGLYSLPSHTGVLFNNAVPLNKRKVSPSQYDTASFDRAAVLFQPKGADDRGAKAAFFELPADYTLVQDGLAINRIADSFSAEFFPDIRKICRFSPRMLAVAKEREPTLLLSAPGAWEISVGERRLFREAVRDYCAFAYENFPEFAPQQTEVLKTTREVLTYAAGHESWLRGLKLETVYLQAFVSFEKYAVLIAAKRLGITSVDIQHGYWDEYSIYNGLPQISPNDISLYPDVMWTWGSASERSLQIDGSSAANNGLVVLGGDVWGARAMDGASHLADLLSKQIGAERYSRRILVTYQVEALLNSEKVVGLLPSLLHEAISRGPRDWLWMLRVHPRSLHLVEPLKEMLTKEGFVNVDVEASSVAQIEPCIELADVFLTGFSASALEANARGKTVLISDEVGKRLFSHFITDGIFEGVDDADQLIEAIAAQRPPTGDIGYYKRDLAHSRSTFDRIGAIHVAATPPPVSMVAEVVHVTDPGILDTDSPAVVPDHFQDEEPTIIAPELTEEVEEGRA